LLKNSGGEERSFEEARAEAKLYTVFPPSENFNLLKSVKEDSSQMDCDEGGSFDASMIESEPPSFHTNASTISSNPQQKMGSRKEGEALFRPEASFEGILNQTAISTASSTVHATDAVGLPSKREEETINTKFAMKELSMMFSSPAFGVDDVARKTERQTARGNRSVLTGCDGVDASFDEIGHMLGNADLDNSIVNGSFANDENQGPRNPMARSIGNPDLDHMALQEVESDVQNATSLRCSSRSRAGPLQVSQEDPLRGPEIPFSAIAGFPIFEDAETERVGSNESVTSHEDETSKISQEDPLRGPEIPFSASAGFPIFQDAESERVGSNESVTSHEDETSSRANGTKATGSLGFTIFKDEVDDGEGNSGVRIETMGRPTESQSLEDGDTASLSIFGNAVSMLDNESGPARGKLRSSRSFDGEDSAIGAGDTATSSLFNEVFQETKRQGKTRERGPFSIFADEGDAGNDAGCGDTATSSLFNEAFGETKQNVKSPMPTSGGFSIFVEGEDDLDVS
jgi:hypothetical protein